MSCWQTASVLPSSKTVVPASQRLPVRCHPARVVMRKKGIHPTYYEEAKVANVYCKGEHVMTVSGTQDEYQVDIWSGNHPLYQGKQSKAPVDDGPLSRFNAKFSEMEEFLTIPTFKNEEVEGLDAYKKKSRKSKK